MKNINYFISIIIVLFIVYILLNSYESMDNNEYDFDKSKNTYKLLAKRLFFNTDKYPQLQMDEWFRFDTNKNRTVEEAGTHPALLNGLAGKCDKDLDCVGFDTFGKLLTKKDINNLNSIDYSPVTPVHTYLNDKTYEEYTLNKVDKKKGKPGHNNPLYVWNANSEDELINMCEETPSCGAIDIQKINDGRFKGSVYDNMKLDTAKEMFEKRDRMIRRLESTRSDPGCRIGLNQIYQ